MSGAVSAIGKIFTPVFDGVKSVIGSAVGGVGAAVATSTAANLGAAAAKGVGSGMLGAASSGVLGSMLGGAAKIGASVFGGIGNSHLAGSAVSDAVTSAAGSPAAAARGGMGLEDKLLDFAKSEGGAGLIAGIGAGLGKYEEAQALAESQQKDRDFLLAKEQRQRDSYKVDDSAVPGAEGTAVDNTPRPTPAQQYARADTPWYWQYDPQTKQTRRVPAGAIG